MAVGADARFSYLAQNEQTEITLYMSLLGGVADSPG